MGLFISIGIVVAVLLAFWLGGKYARSFIEGELLIERGVSAELRKQRNDAMALMGRTKAAAVEAGLDVAKLFPFLTVLIFAAALWSCGGGGGKLCLAQSPGTYYSPEGNLERQDKITLDSAKQSIDYAAFSLTDQVACDALKVRALAGVQERIYLDRGELQAECRGDISCSKIPLHELIGLQNVVIRVKFSKVLMHLKSYAVDGRLIRDGSANFSLQGESRQDNSATFSGRPEDVAAFEKKFQAMWDRPDNLTVAQALSPGAKAK